MIQRVVFMGTPEFAVPCLEKLHSQYSVVGVYTQPDKPLGRGLEWSASPVKKKAVALGIPVFQPEKLSLPGEYEKLQSLRPDVIVVAAYGQILKQNVLDLPRLGCVNVHSSLLPRWRGAAPIQWAILGGDRETGITTMKMVAKLDAGDILLEKKTLIDAHETAQTLHDRLAAFGAEMMIPTLEGLDTGTLKARPQDESGVTVATKLTKDMEWLDPLTDTAETLDRRIRALNPWPGTRILLGERLKIKKAQVRQDIQGRPGDVFERAGMVLLGCKDGSLELLQVQWDGKKEVDAAGFLNGLRGRKQELPLRVSPHIHL